MISGWRRPTRPSRPGAGRVRWDRFHKTANCGNAAEKRLGRAYRELSQSAQVPQEQALFNDSRHSGRDTHHPPGTDGADSRMRWRSRIRPAANRGFSRPRLLRVDSHSVRIEPWSRPGDGQHGDRHQAVEHGPATANIEPRPHGRIRGVHNPSQRAGGSGPEISASARSSRAPARARAI